MLTILNDIHIGAARVAGTTPQTQLALRERTRTEFKRLLPDSGDLMLLGDLFDTNLVPLYEVAETFKILSDWCAKHPTSRLYNVRGNHDASKSSNVLSSFDFLGQLMLRHHANYVHVVEPAACPYGYMIPHMPNQDLFEHALKNMPQTSVLFLHCNYDNHFAAQADQSLNLSKEQASWVKCGRIVIAHEHHYRYVSGGKVVIPGNQIATSVSDWLSDHNKFFTTIQDDFTVKLVECAVKSQELIELPWDDLQQVTQPFIRVVGSVDAEQASGVLSALVAYRKRSEALVITNGVSVATSEGALQMEQVLENVATFNIMEALKPLFSAEEYAVLEQSYAATTAT